jgi:alkylated DNA nucleotide flippase Atl1
MTERDGGPRNARVVDDYVDQVLQVVEAIPPGRVMSYGDIAEYLASGGPRQVGRVLATYGGGVAWWRVIHADGTPAPGHDLAALKHYRAEGTPLRSADIPVRVDMRAARWPGPDAADRAVPLTGPAAHRGHRG